MNSENILPWYFAAVGALLLIAQNVLMGNAHAEALARLKVQHEKELAVATATASSLVAAAGPAASAPVTTLAPEAAAAAPTPRRDEKGVALSAAPAPAAVPAPAAAPAPAMEKADMAAMEPRHPQEQVPVALSFRTEPFEKGRIVLVSNKSGQKLPCQIRVQRPGTGQSQVIPVLLAPSGEARVTGGKDWTFRTGDRIEIANAAYQSLTAAIP